MKRCVRIVLVGLMSIVIVLFSAWSSMALWFDGPSARWLAGTLAGAYGAGMLLAWLLVRPYRRALLVWLTSTGLVLAWWLSIPPRNDRNWIEDVARLPRAEIAGDRLHG